MFFKELVDEKNDKVKLDFIPKTNEEYISVTYGCIRFIDSYRFLSSSFDSLVRTLVDNSHKTLDNSQKSLSWCWRNSKNKRYYLKNSNIKNGEELTQLYLKSDVL